MNSTPLSRCLLASAALLGIASMSLGQTRLPPVDAASSAPVSPVLAGTHLANEASGASWPLPPRSATVIQDPAFRLAEAPSLPVSDPLGVEALQRDSILPPGTRNGVFQKVNVGGSYIPRFESDSLGISKLSTDVVFGVPFPERQSPLLITPAYRVSFLDSPDFTDVPARVHDAELGLSHFRKLNDRWMFNGAVTLGVYADDHSFGDSEAFRVTGRALGIRELTSTWKGIIGVVYLNRAGFSVVPAAGLTYDRGDLKIDLVFPRPRVAWLLPGSTPQPGDQRWFFLQGELGGNIWAVRRSTGAEDALSYGDARVLVGYERKVIGGISQRWELGYVFNRELEFDSEGFESELDDSMFVRAGWTY
ncbi:MAG: DUF6268 family outer membrane beta-barrel protein [Planctomycetota bacterium]